MCQPADEPINASGPRCTLGLGGLAPAAVHHGHVCRHLATARADDALVCIKDAGRAQGMGPGRLMHVCRHLATARADDALVCIKDAGRAQGMGPGRLMQVLHSVYACISYHEAPAHRSTPPLQTHPLTRLDPAPPVFHSTIILPPRPPPPPLPLPPRSICPRQRRPYAPRQRRHRAQCRHSRRIIISATAVDCAAQSPTLPGTAGGAIPRGKRCLAELGQGSHAGPGLATGVARKGHERAPG